MSLSQKHQNLILVPWYNIEEWRYVYKLAYSSDKAEQGKALEMLKIWKIRTPILAAGIEGTLIILDSLLLDSGDLPEERLQDMYSVALVRFINLSAAHNDKQGTFYKTAVKNALPKWLISLRHDIAHGHKLPSKSMLEMGLKFGLDWLKEKYWEPQNTQIEDYVVEEFTDGDYFRKTLKAYITLKMADYQKIDLTSNKTGFLQDVTDIVYKKFHRSSVTVDEMIQIVEEMLRNSLYNNKNKTIGDMVAEVLVDGNCLLYPAFEEDERNGEEKIDKNFRDIWADLLNILHENRLLFCLVNRLFDATGDITVGESNRKMASYWLCEIFFSLFILKMVKDHIDSMVLEFHSKINIVKTKNLIKSKLKSNSCFNEYLELDSIHYIYLEEAKKFESKVMHLPNEYTLNYLEIVLKFNNRSDAFISDSISLLKNNIPLNIVAPNLLQNYDEDIHTLEELTLNLSFDDENSTKTNVKNRFLNNDEEEIHKNVEITEDHEMVDLSNYLNGVSSFGNKRWRVITDTSSFSGCPIGVLPHQNRNESPLVQFYK